METDYDVFDCGGRTDAQLLAGMKKRWEKSPPKN